MSATGKVGEYLTVLYSGTWIGKFLIIIPKRELNYKSNGMFCIQEIDHVQKIIAKARVCQNPKIDGAEYPGSLGIFFAGVCGADDL